MALVGEIDFTRTRRKQLDAFTFCSTKLILHAHLVPIRNERSLVETLEGKVDEIRATVGSMVSSHMDLISAISIDLSIWDAWIWVAENKRSPGLLEHILLAGTRRAPRLFFLHHKRPPCESSCA